MKSLSRVVATVGGMVWLATAIAVGQTTTATDVKQFEVISVVGNELVVKLPEGNRQLTVPEDFRFTIEGNPVSVHELRPGMTGTATITTRTTMTPVSVTEVKNGTVAQVGGGSIVVRTAEGVRSFTQSDIDKRGIQIVRDGKPAQLSDFRAGDTLSATIITTRPPTTMTEREVQATLAAAAAPPASVGTSGAAPPPEPALPSTAGPLPLIALSGLTSLAIAAALARRRYRTS